jgi:uncharacterized membrane protein
MKSTFATWWALGGIVVVMGLWIVTSGLGQDHRPYILLNLCLSCIAALQCFVLLIAAKRADQISSEVALHTEANTVQLVELLDENTRLTNEVAKITREVHALVAGRK